jgi:hypothetical protein
MSGAALFGLRGVLVTVLVAVLAGCAGRGAPPATASAPAPRAASVSATPALADEIRRAAICVDQVEGRPAFAPLRAKSPDTAQMTPAHLADESLATPEEQELLRKFAAAIQPCRPRFAADGKVERIVLDTWAKQERLYADLATKRIAWGRFNRLSGDLEDTFRATLQPLAQSSGSPR